MCIRDRTSAREATYNFYGTRTMSVSYTHLDVYKRQLCASLYRESITHSSINLSAVVGASGQTILKVISHLLCLFVIIDTCPYYVCVNIKSYFIQNEEVVFTHLIDLLWIYRGSTCPLKQFIWFVLIIQRFYIF